jgi:hypothetical protein
MPPIFVYMVIGSPATRSKQMIIKHVNMADLGEVIAQLVAKGLTFEATPYAEGMWTIRITGGQ